MSLKVFTKNLKACYIIDLEKDAVIRSFVHKKAKEVGFKIKGLPVIDSGDV